MICPKCGASMSHVFEGIHCVNEHAGVAVSWYQCGCGERQGVSTKLKWVPDEYGITKHLVEYKTWSV